MAGSILRGSGREYDFGVCIGYNCRCRYKYLWVFIYMGTVIIGTKILSS